MPSAVCEDAACAKAFVRCIRLGNTAYFFTKASRRIHSIPKNSSAASFRSELRPFCSRKATYMCLPIRFTSSSSGT
jgi:hypothetical protein